MANCEICKTNKAINWKDAETLRRFTSEQAKILPKRKTYLCAKHQRQIARAIKRARVMALMPFVAR